MFSRIIRRQATCDIVGLSYSTINRLERRGDFPRRVQLGSNSVGWIEDEVRQWIKQRSRVIHDKKPIESGNGQPIESSAPTKN